jgi:hypothetical protein
MFSRKQRIAESILQAQFISEALREKLTIQIPETVTVKPTPFPSFLTEIWKPDSGLIKVPAGETRTVYEFKISDLYFGVVRALAWSYYDGDELQLSIDDQPVYNQPIKWALGNYPNTTVPALKPFTRNVKMSVKNNAEEDHSDYGMICKGPIVYQKDKALLLDLVSKGVL